MKLKENGYPEFWGVVKKDFNKKLINPKLECPMNYLGKVEFKNDRSSASTLPMSYFFVNHPIENRMKSKKVEDLIEKYSFKMYSDYYSTDGGDEEYLLLRSDFDELIEDIQKLYLSKNSLGLMSWLLNRAFCITSNMKGKSKEVKSTINMNKSVLLKVLYTVSKGNLLQCFSKNIVENSKK